MTRLNTALRRDALRCLQGRWGKGIAGMLFLSGVRMIILLLEQFCLTASSLLEPATLQVPFLGIRISPVQSAVSILFGLLTFLTMVPLLMGVLKWYYRLSDGPTPDLRTIFDYLSAPRLYCKTLLLGLTIIFRTVLFGAVISLLPAGVWVALKMVGSIGNSIAAIGQALLFFLFLVLTVLAAVLTICFSLRYFLAPYYFAEDEHIPIRQAVCRSVKAMKRMQGQVFGLLLGWTPLWLSCILVAPLLFAAPYCSAALAINARYLMGREIRQSAEPQVTADTIVF